MKKLLNTKISILFLTLALLYSCDENEFLDRYPLDVPNPQNFFTDASAAQSAIAAAFDPWKREMYSWRRDMNVIFDCMTDDAYRRPVTSQWIQQEMWDIYPTHPTITAYWRMAYQSINTCNFAIEGIPNSSDPSFDDAARQSYIAQARFLRAYGYLFLTTLFGDVPLILKTLSSFEEFEQPRVAKSEVFKQIIDDFKFSKDNLPDSWPNAVGAPTRAAGAAFLAKAYLFNEDYINAESAARDAIQIAESTGYELIDDYESIFSKDNEKNPELLFYLSFVDNVPGYGQQFSIERVCRSLPAQFYSIWGMAGWGYTLPQRDLYDAYEEGDPRRGYTIYAPGDIYGNYADPNPFTYKHLKFDEVTGERIEYTVTYKPGDTVEYDHRWSETGMSVKKLLMHMGDLAANNQAGHDQPLMRMAELYLFLAEALAEQGKSEALVWVNKVRARPSVNMPPKTAADGNLVDIVRHERRVELAMEGVRLFDIMRWKNLGEIFYSPTAVKRHYYSDVWTSADNIVRWDMPMVELPKHYLFPIPQDEIDQNNQINTNNPGY